MTLSTPMRALRWDGRQLYFGGLFVGEVMTQTLGPRTGQWRVYALTEAPGAHHGWYGSEAEARRHLEAVVRAALPSMFG